MENPRRSICTWKIGWIVVFVLIVHALPNREGGNHNNENYCLLDSIYQAVKDEYCNGNSGNSCDDEYCNGNSGNSCEETCCQDDTDNKCEECCKDVFENLRETCCQDNTDNKCEGLVDDCFKKKHNGTNNSFQQANKVKRKCLNKILPCLALPYKGTSETGTELISYGKRQFPRNETIKLISYSALIGERTSDDQNADLEVILPAELTERAAENQNDLSGLSFHVFKDTNLFEDEKHSTLLNQQVFGITVGNSSFQNLKEGVSIKVNHSVATPNGYVHRCVFWFESEDENIVGSWNSTGCNTTVEENQTICVCNHLTYFAVLMDPRADSVILDQTDLTSLTYISKIGCGISAFFVAITVFVHCVIRKNQGNHTNKIHINLCIACFLLNVNFLTNEWLSKLAIDGLCKAIAVFLHYSLLSTFAWMAIEGFHLYLMLVKVFNIYVRHYIYKLAFMGWGIPAVVVFVCVGVNPDNYGTFEIHTLDTNSSVSMCWIKNNTIHYVTNCGFFGLIWLMNLAMMITVCTKLTQMRNNTHSGSRPVCKDLWAILGLSVLLGITWCLAFFSFEAQVVQLYLFCILNCLQGFFIFLWYCAVKRSANEQSTNYTSDK